MKHLPGSIQISGGVLPIPDHVDYYALVAATPKEITIPAGANFVLFWCDTDLYYIEWSGIAAAVPAPDIDDGSCVDVCPVARQIVGKTTFSAIAPVNSNLCVSYWM